MAHYGGKQDNPDSFRFKSLFQLKTYSNLLFWDLPYVLDRLFRKLEFHSNLSVVRDEHRHSCSDDGHCDVPNRTNKTYGSATSIFAIVILFAFFGSNLDVLCSAGNGPIIVYALAMAVTGLLIYVALKLHHRIKRSIESYYRKPLHKAPEHSARDNLGCRQFLLKVLMFFLAAMLIPIGPFYLAYYIVEHRDVVQYCTETEFSYLALGQFVVALGMIGLVFLADKTKWLSITKPYYSFIPLIVFLLVLALMLPLSGYFSGEFNVKEASNRPYINSFLLGMILLSFPLLFSTRLVKSLFQKFVGYEKFKNRLIDTELFTGKPDLPEMTYPRGFYGTFVSPSRNLVYLLLLPCLVAIMAPRNWLMINFWFTFFVSGIIVYGGGIAKRWDRIRFVISRYFFQGLPIIVSYVVIGLGIARVLDIHFIASVLDVAPLGSISILILMFYAAFWFYDNWLNRPLQAKLFEILGGDGDSGNVCLQGYRDKSKAVDDVPDVTNDVDVLNRHRDLQLHGSSSFMVVGEIKSKEADKNGCDLHLVYQVWNPLELFKKLSGDDDSSLNTQKDKGLVKEYRSLRRRFLLYRATMNGAAVAVFALAISALGGFSGESTALIPYSTVTQSGSINLADKLTEQAQLGKPAIILAASGGGTRAALYTHAVLRGLARIEATKDIVLASGVSGGGVGLAYFASHYDVLSKAQANDESWVTFRAKMKEPFIQDVLEGVLEPRILWKTRMGKLLAESFDRRLTNETGVKNIGETKFGLMLNTTITAHPFNDATITTNLFKDQDTADAPNYTVFAGSRLIFTNLDDVSSFPGIGGSKKAGLFDEDVYLPTMLLQDDSNQISLMTAAALNANFPPVFQDAPVDVGVDEDMRRYFVTDGGAMDNRGVISALYALRGAITKGSLLPKKIFMVVAEASATGYDYSGERGLGAAFSSAKIMLANGLIHELYTDINQSLKVRGGDTELEIVYLDMPLVLRARGGLGTHWIMPHKIKFNDPTVVNPNDKNAPDSVSLKKETFLSLLDEIHPNQVRKNINLDDSLCNSINEMPITEKTKSLFNQMTEAEKCLKVESWIFNSEQENGVRVTSGGHSKAWDKLVEAYAKSDVLK